jgi:hypothetical protein
VIDQPAVDDPADAVDPDVGHIGPLGWLREPIRS